VILLSRKDLNALAESLSYANYFQNFTEKYKWIKTPNLNENIKLVKEFNEELEKLSKLTNIKISYYEDLFNLESEDKLRKNDFKRENLI
jgi:tRNA (Thr-GGU) A37 N-methylase